MESYFIPYRNQGGTIVDWDFTNPIHCFNWFTNKTGYAQAKTPRPNPKGLYMHRLLLGFPNEVDHINGKRNDNRILNLRSVTHRQNGSNHGRHRAGNLVGACFKPADEKWNRDKWRSDIHINGRRVNLGHYDTEIEAHLAWFMYKRGL